MHRRTLHVHAPVCRRRVRWARRMQWNVFRRVFVGSVRADRWRMVVLHGELPDGVDVRHERRLRRPLSRIVPARLCVRQRTLRVFAELSCRCGVRHGRRLRRSVQRHVSRRNDVFQRRVRVRTELRRRGVRCARRLRRPVRRQLPWRPGLFQSRVLRAELQRSCVRCARRMRGRVQQWNLPGGVHVHPWTL